MNQKILSEQKSSVNAINGNDSGLFLEYYEKL